MRELHFYQRTIEEGRERDRALVAQHATQSNLGGVVPVRKLPVPPFFYEPDMITFDVAPEHMAIAGLCVLIAAIALVVWRRTRRATPQKGEVRAVLGGRDE